MGAIAASQAHMRTPTGLAGARPAFGASAR